VFPRGLAESAHRDISAYGDWRAYMNGGGRAST
jgi:hypothetical protein